jgi:hypothetical protein
MSDADLPDALRELSLDHVGIQVGELTPAIQAFAKYFGYHQATEPVINTRHQVEVVFLEKEGSMPIKLFRSIADPKKLPPKLHHLALRTNQIEGAVEALRQAGARILNEPAPGEAFDDEPIAFLFAAGLNVELVSTDKRRSRIESEP